MQTFTFNELSDRAQGIAVRLYCSTPEILEWQEKHGNNYGKVTPAFIAIDWRYTEHGERVA